MPLCDGTRRHASKEFVDRIPLLLPVSLDGAARTGILKGVGDLPQILEEESYRYILLQSMIIYILRIFLIGVEICMSKL